LPDAFPKGVRFFDPLREIFRPLFGLVQQAQVLQRAGVRVLISGALVLTDELRQSLPFLCRSHRCAVTASASLSDLAFNLQLGPRVGDLILTASARCGSP